MRTLYFKLYFTNKQKYYYIVIKSQHASKKHRRKLVKVDNLKYL